MKTVFLTKDLLSLRAKLLRYVKEECDGQFKQALAVIGKILIKENANSKDEQQSKSEDKRKWLRIKTPDDPHRYGVIIDFQKLNFLLLCIVNERDCEI